MCNTGVQVGKSRTEMDNRNLLINADKRQRRGLESKCVPNIVNSWVTFLKSLTKRPYVNDDNSKYQHLYAEF